MASLSSPPDLDLLPDILRESDPDPLRLILWLPVDTEARCRHWRRVSGHFLGAAAPADGLHVLAARVVPFREDFRGEVRRLFDRFWAGRGQGAARFILPTGAWVEPEGEPRDDALLAWADEPGTSLDGDRLTELWPGHEACLRLGPGLVLVLGVTPPAPATPPAAVPPPPAESGEGRPRPAARVHDPEFAGQFRDRRRRVKALIHRGHHEEALAEASGLLELARQRWFDGHPAVGTCLLVLAVVHHGRDEHDLAERLYREVLDIYCPELGDNHPNFATGLNNLALLYQARGQGADAEPLLRQALDIRLASMGELHALTGASMHNLALLLHGRGDPIAAESLLLRALHVFRHTFGEAHPDVATCLDGLAALYQHLGDDGTASILIGQADEARRAADGKEHVRIADTLNLLGELAPERRDAAAADGGEAPAVATAGGVSLEADPLARLTPAATTDLPDDTPAPVGLAIAPEEPADLPLLLEEAAAEDAAAPAEPAPLPDEGVPPAPTAVSMPPEEATPPETLSSALDELFLIFDEEDPPADPVGTIPEEAVPAPSVAEGPVELSAESPIAAAVEASEAEDAPGSPESDPVLPMADAVDAAAPNDYAIAPPEPAASEPYPAAVPVLPEEIMPPVADTSATAEQAATHETGNSPELPESESYPVAVPVLPEEALAAWVDAPEPVEALCAGEASIPEPAADEADASTELPVAQLPPAEAEVAGLADEPPMECASAVLPADAGDASHIAAALADVGSEDDNPPAADLAWAPPEGEDIPGPGSELPVPEAPPLPVTAPMPDIPPDFLDAVLPGLVCASAWAPEAASLPPSGPLGEPVLLPPTDPGELVANDQDIAFRDVTADVAPGEQPAAAEVRLPEPLPPDDGPCLAYAAAGRVAEAITLLQRALARGQSSAAEELPPANDAGGMPTELALFLSLVRQHPTAVPGAATAALDFVLRDRAAPDALGSAEDKGQEVARRLPPGSALVEFVRFRPLDLDGLAAGRDAAWLPARYVAFVLPAGATADAALVDLGDAATIDRLVADCRARLVDRPGGERAAPAWRPAGSEGRALRATAALRQAVFDPLAATLGNRSRLFLAPVGSLACLPFEVLTHADGRTLLESHTISYVTSGLDVLGFGAEPAERAGPAVVAVDPDFDLFLAPGCRPFPDPDGPPGRFPRLPGTRRAGKQFAALLGVEPWRAAAVRKGRLRAVRSPRVLHLGTHCVFAEGDTWLALAGANGSDPAWPPEGDDDGLLSADEVAALDLAATQLVVLPACDAAGADAARGDGLRALRRAFQAAGAASVVTSLWRVTDWHAKELLADFYERVLAGEPRAEAVRGAQLALKERYPDHPEYWSAFVCQGDPGPLPSIADRVDAAPQPARSRWHWRGRRRPAVAQR